MNRILSALLVVLVACMPANATVDDALAYALEAAQPYIKEGFTVREDYWGGDMAVGQPKAITQQLFKGNEYWFWMATDVKSARISVHVYDSDGNLCEVDARQKGQFASARVVPKRSGTFYIIVEIEKSPQERTHWGMAYGFR
ncbi:MAG: hypothetical protein ABMA01_09685 [Chthoniobacteraceae bacterium]